MAGRGDQICVVIIAIGEMGTLLEKEIPSILRFELGVVPIQVVSAELVEHENYHQLRLRIVSISKARPHTGENKEHECYETTESRHN